VKIHNLCKYRVTEFQKAVLLCRKAEEMVAAYVFFILGQGCQEVCSGVYKCIVSDVNFAYIPNFFYNSNYLFAEKKT